MEYMDESQSITHSLASANLFEVRLLVTDEVTVLPDRWRPRNFVRPYDVLFAVISGEISAESEDESFLMKAGDVRLFPVNTVFSHSCRASARILAVRFHAQFVTGFGLLDGIRCALESPELLSQFWTAYDRFAAAPDLFKQLALKSIVWAYVSAFAELNCDRTERYLRSFETYGRIFELLEKASAVGLPVKDLARAVGMTPGSLSTRFKQDMGVSLKRYMIRRAIRLGSERLLLTHQSIKEIAYELGFSDPLYFSRLFRRHTGLSPRQFRESEQGPLMTPST